MKKNEQEKKEILTKESSFLVESFKEHSHELFGVKPEVIDGAFFHAKKGEQFTKSEAKRRIDSFLKKKVKKEDNK